jgi:hypothetical protein
MIDAVWGNEVNTDGLDRWIIIICGAHGVRFFINSVIY